MQSSKTKVAVLYLTFLLAMLVTAPAPKAHASYILQPSTGSSARQITLVVGSGDITSTGTKACSVLENSGTITGVHLISNALPTGADLIVDVLTVAFSSYTGFGSASSITASDIPTITTGAMNPRYSDTTLTGWTTSLAAATVVCVGINSAPTGGATYASLTLDIQ